MPWLPVKRPRSRFVTCAVIEYMIWSLLSLSSNVWVSGQSGLLVAQVTVRVCVVREGATPPKNHSLFCTGPGGWAYILKHPASGKVVNRTEPLNVAAAAHVSAVRVESISYMTGFAVAVAVATMVGQ